MTDESNKSASRSLIEDLMEFIEKETMDETVLKRRNEALQDTVKSCRDRFAGQHFSYFIMGFLHNEIGELKECSTAIRAGDTEIMKLFQFVFKEIYGSKSEDHVRQILGHINVDLAEAFPKLWKHPYPNFLSARDLDQRLRDHGYEFTPQYKLEKDGEVIGHYSIDQLIHFAIDLKKRDKK